MKIPANGSVSDKTVVIHVDKSEAMAVLEEIERKVDELQAKAERLNATLLQCS